MDEDAANSLVENAVHYLSDAEALAQRVSAHRYLAWGMGLIAVGGGITIATYLSADAGGAYFFWFGPVIFGGIALIRGIRGNASATYRSAGIAFAVITLIVGVAFYSVYWGPVVEHLETGDCLDAESFITDCGGVSHRYTVTSVHEVADQEKYPDESYFTRTYDARCSSSSSNVLSPTSETWDAGDRQFVCLSSR